MKVQGKTGDRSFNGYGTDDWHDVHAQLQHVQRKSIKSSDQVKAPLSGENLVITETLGDLVRKLLTAKDDVERADASNLLIAKLQEEIIEVNLASLSTLSSDELIEGVLLMESQGILGELTKRITPDAFDAHPDIVKNIQAARGITLVEKRFNKLLTDGENKDASVEVLLTLIALPELVRRECIYYLDDNKLFDEFTGHLKFGLKLRFAQELQLITDTHKNHLNPDYKTHNTSVTQERRMSEILNPTQTGTGNSVPFENIVKDKFGKDRTYKEDLMEKFEFELDWLFRRAKLYEDVGFATLDWSFFESIAAEAKKQTDALYGSLRAGPAFTHEGSEPTILDRHEEEVKESDLFGLGYYILIEQEENIGKIDSNRDRYPDQTIHQAHNADPSRAEEQSIIKEVIDGYLGDYFDRAMLETVEKGWPGEHVGGKMLIQRHDPGDEYSRRFTLWDNFQTAIHEYIHSITAPEYDKYAREKGGLTFGILIEGGTSYFTDQVWKAIYPNEIRANSQLRANVEGQSFPYQEDVIKPVPDHYPQINDIFKIVETIGENNFKAAFFLGEVDKLG